VQVTTSSSTQTLPPGFSQPGAVRVVGAVGRCSTGFWRSSLRFPHPNATRMKSQLRTWTSSLSKRQVRYSRNASRWRIGGEIVSENPPLKRNPDNTANFFLAGISP
jgi:hypothetical protein